MAGPSYSQVRQAGGLGTIAGENSMEAFDRAVLNAQNRTKGYEDINTNRLAQIKTGQLIEENELKLKRMRDMEAWRQGGMIGPPPNQKSYLNDPTQANPMTRGFDQSAVQSGANYLESNYQKEAFGVPQTGPSVAQPVTETAAEPSSTGGFRNKSDFVNSFAAIWSDLEGRFNLPAGYLARTADIESDSDPNAQNPNSTAGGLFQFIDKTAKEYGLTNKFDPLDSSVAAARLAANNQIRLEKLIERRPTPAELYLAHQQGADGAAKLINMAKTQPTDLATSLVGIDEVKLNGGNKQTTVSEFVKLWKDKFQGQSMDSIVDTFNYEQPFTAVGSESGLEPRFQDRNRQIYYPSFRRQIAEYPEQYTATIGQQDYPQDYKQEVAATEKTPAGIRPKINFDFPSPRQPENLAGAVVPQDIVDAANATNIRPGQRPLPVTTGGTFTLTQLDVPINMPDGTSFNYVEYNPITQEIRGPNGQVIPEFLKTQALESAAYNFNESAQNNVDTLTSKVATLKAELDNASPAEYAGKLQTYTDTLTQLNNAKAQLDGSYSELPGSLRLDRNIFSGEGPEAGITKEAEQKNLEKLKKLETARQDIKQKTDAAFGAVGGLPQNQITNEAGQKAIEKSVQILKRNGLKVTGKDASQAVVPVNAKMYTLDPNKVLLARSQAALATEHLALLRMQGKATEYRALQLSLGQTEAYLRGMEVIQEVRKGNLQVLANLFATTYQTSDVDLRVSSDNKISISVKGNPLPTIQNLTTDQVVEYLGFTFDNQYKDAQMALSKSAVEFQQELLTETHKASLDLQKELVKAKSTGAANLIIERFKASNKVSIIDGQAGRFTYTGEDGRLYYVDTQSPNLLDPDSKTQPFVARVQVFDTKTGKLVDVEQAQ